MSLCGNQRMGGMWVLHKAAFKAHVHAMPNAVGQWLLNKC